MALGLGTLIGAGLGLGQLAAGIFTKKGDRPEYQIPEAIQSTANQAIMESQASRRQGRGVADSLIERQAQTALQQVKSAASSGSQVAMGALAAQQAANQAYLQQDMQDAQDLQMRRAMRDRALANLGQQQQMKQQYDVLQPYEQRAGAKSALLGSGIQNIFGVAKEYDRMKMFENIYGGGSAARSNAVMPPVNISGRIGGIATPGVFGFKGY